MHIYTLYLYLIITITNILIIKEVVIETSKKQAKNGKNDQKNTKNPKTELHKY
jgi:hypothetical protein